MKKHFGAMMGVAIKSAKLIKSIKALKVALSLSSMALFGFCESWILGLALALSVVFLLFLHEMGHALALKAKGYGMKLPLFIPFLGAVIFAPKFEDRETEAYVGLGGPLLGTLAALLFAVPYYFTQQSIWLSGSFLGLAINLFNMVPISPFDGGRVTQAAEPRLRYLGYAALVWFTAVLGESGMLILWILVIIDLAWTTERKLRWCRMIVLAMVVLTALRVGKQLAANIIDCCAGTLILAIYEVFHRWTRRAVIKEVKEAFPGLSDEAHDELYASCAVKREKEKSPQDQRPMPAGRARLLWLLLWVSLAVVQFWIMHGESKLMKK